VDVADHPGPSGEPDHVEDEPDASGPKDRRTGEDLEPMQLRSEGFHHDLRRIAEPVDQQPEPTIVRLEHDEEAAGGRLLVVAAKVELARQGDDRQQPIAEAIDGDLVEDLDGPWDDADELEQVLDAPLRRDGALRLEGFQVAAALEDPFE